MALTLPVKIGYFKAAHYAQGRTEPIRALVNHRMVGYVLGTRAYFQNSSTRPVSTHFGIGFSGTKLIIDQYVPLDDTAFGNGNYDATGSWDNWGYKTTEINAQTISIEHQDHGDPKGKGVVSEQVQQASIALQALLLKGSIAEWKAAGVVVRDWTNNAPIVQRELRRIPIDGRHIITHHDIAGKLKPYCWLPWQYDKVGFPRTKYVNGIKTLIAPPVVTPPPVEPVPPPVITPDPKIYSQLELDVAIARARLLATQETKAKVIAYTQSI